MKKSNTQPPISRLYHMYKFRALMDKISDEELKKVVGLSQSSYFILLGISQEKTTNQKALSFFLGISEAAVSKQIQPLIKKSLLKRIENENDRRLYNISLTEKGLSIVYKASSALEIFYDGVFGRPSKIEMLLIDTQTKKMLKKIEHFLSLKK